MDKEEIKKNVSQNILKCVKASGKSIDKQDADVSSAWIELGVSRKVFRDLASLPYDKKKVVVDMINVLSKKG